jgi:hypothetical protein
MPCTKNILVQIFDLNVPDTTREADVKLNVPHDYHVSQRVFDTGGFRILSTGGQHRA